MIVAGVQLEPGQGPAPRLDALIASTERLDAAAPDLVVWGESSVGFDLSAPHLVERISKASRAAGAEVLVNVDARRAAGGIYKSSVLVDSSGVVGPYDKMRLVPFGEYVPAR